jgi:hypothetical protein
MTQQQLNQARIQAYQRPRQLNEFNALRNMSRQGIGTAPTTPKPTSTRPMSSPSPTPPPRRPKPLDPGVYKKDEQGNYHSVPLVELKAVMELAEWLQENADDVAKSLGWIIKKPFEKSNDMPPRPEPMWNEIVER